MHREPAGAGAPNHMPGNSGRRLHERPMRVHARIERIVYLVLQTALLTLNIRCRADGRQHALEWRDLGRTSVVDGWFLVALCLTRAQDLSRRLTRIAFSVCYHHTSWTYGG